MSEIAGPLLLIGCGKMGHALLAGWLERGLARDQAFVVEPHVHSRESVSREFGVTVVPAPAELPAELRPLAVVFAIKPQMMADALPDYREIVAGGPVVLSIAAGTVVARFEEAFGPETPVVRAMPNTPAAIGRGVSALFANHAASAAQQALCNGLMSAVGSVHWISDEDLMHPITAMSGGGPAYLVLLIETLAHAGIANGMPAELAWAMARDTVTGAGALAAASDEEAEVLRRNVTSPGGTTEAALDVLMDRAGGIQPLFDRAIAAGVARSAELA
jgi:pyrroline-5-carboxylate reductase